MARAMFEYTKEVLLRVSFDVQLFSKELQKAVKRLLPYEVNELRFFVENLVRSNPELQPSLLYLTR
jgi:coproporphyrinogen III oxidase-like Fe-S oxidoreductase